jgi:flagellar biosynthetic protein FliR
MTHFDLGAFLSGHVFGFLILFCRLGSVLMLFPGIGETYVSPRTRLLFAVSFCFVLLEPMLPMLPKPPEAIPDLVRMLTIEIVIGLFFGTLLRLIISCLEAAGTVIGLQTGLSNATVLNPALATQSPLPSAMLSVAGLALIFVTGLDHYLFRSMIMLYDVFPPGTGLMPGDMAQVVIQAANRSFILGIDLATPFFVVGLLLNIAVGILQRLMPQLQLFMIVLPVQIWGGLILFSLTIASILTIWLRFFDDYIANFLSR